MLTTPPGTVTMNVDEGQFCFSRLVVSKKEEHHIFWLGPEMLLLSPLNAGQSHEKQVMCDLLHVCHLTTIQS